MADRSIREEDMQAGWFRRSEESYAEILWCRDRDARARGRF